MGKHAMEMGHFRANRFGDTHRFVAIHPHQQDGEFLIANPAKEILGPQLGGAGLAEVGQHPVAGPVAPAVVDLAEIIHIDVEQGQGHPFGKGPFQFLVG